MLTFGFEREYFVFKQGADGRNDDPPVLCPASVPNDCGLMAEARGKPHEDPIEAAYSLLAEQERIERQLEKLGLYLDDGMNLAIMPRALRIEAARVHSKRLVQYQNLYGHKHHSNKANEITASIHVSVARKFTTAGCLKCKTPGVGFGQIFDYAAFVRIMDKEFASHIKLAKRKPGFYEIKHDGRVEYRSLPMSVDPVVVARFLADSIKLIHGSWS